MVGVQSSGKLLVTPDPRRSRTCHTSDRKRGTFLMEINATPNKDCSFPAFTELFSRERLILFFRASLLNAVVSIERGATIEHINASFLLSE